MAQYSERMPMVDQAKIRDSVTVGLALLVVLVFSSVLDLAFMHFEQPRPTSTAAVMQASRQGGGSMVYVFTKTGCPFCDKLRPSVQRAARQGYPVAEMNIATPLGSLAVRQLGLTKVPVAAVFDPNPMNPSQLMFRAGTQPKVVLTDNELRELFRLESIQPQLASGGLR
jgi:thiol-disulfide isomerase/thioredoxin